MNKFYDNLITELTAELGGEACRADWDEFHAEIAYIRRVAAGLKCDRVNQDEVEEEAIAIHDQIAGSRADLPSILAFITAEIEGAA